MHQAHGDRYRLICPNHHHAHANLSKMRSQNGKISSRAEHLDRSAAGTGVAGGYTLSMENLKA